MSAKRRLLFVTSMASSILFLLAWHWLMAPPAPISFETAQELRSFAVANGLEARNDGKADSTIFYISDHPLSRDDIVAVATRRDFGRTPSWRGVVWAAQVKSPSTTTYPIQGFGSHWRLWGKMIVAGDAQLMDRIEELYWCQRRAQNIAAPWGYGNLKKTTNRVSGYTPASRLEK
jgi:hypothetical protein